MPSATGSLQLAVVFACCLAVSSCLHQPAPDPIEEAFTILAGSRTAREYRTRTGKEPALRFDRREGENLVFALGESQETHFATSEWLKLDENGAVWIYDITADRWQRE